MEGMFEHMDGIVGLVIQTSVILIGLGAVWGSLNSTIRGHGIRLTKVENVIDKMQEMNVVLARFEERFSSMDQRVLAQGVRLDATNESQNKRVDTSLALINGRLDAINNIMSGHTAQLNTLPRVTKVT